MKKVFVVMYQPKEKSDKQEYIDAFIQENQNKGNEVRILNIHDIEVDYLNMNGAMPDNNLTPELKEAQDNIIWADELVVIYSVWCLNIPAKLKAFIERVFQADVLVKMGERGPEPLLKNKSLVIMQSYGMPFVFMKYFCGDLPFKFVKMVFSNWCGFKLKKRFDFDMIDNVSEKTRQKWLKQIKKYVNS